MVIRENRLRAEIDQLEARGGGSKEERHSLISQVYNAPIEAIARHEAAHATISLVLGLNPTNVQIWPVALAKNDLDDPPLASALMSLAGPLSDLRSEVYDGLRSNPINNTGDLAQANGALLRVAGYSLRRDAKMKMVTDTQWRVIEKLLPIAQMLAAQLVEKFWDGILSLAQELLERGELNGVQIRGVIGDLEGRAVIPADVTEEILRAVGLS